MAILPASQFKGRIHFGLMSLRTDEFEAVLQCFPAQDQILGADRLCSLYRFTVGAASYTATVMRCLEQGTGEAQDAARDLIGDLDPHWLVVVSIAGGVPSDDFSLGDVIVATQIIDFIREAVKQDQPPEFNLSGGPVHKSVRPVVAQLAALKADLGAWNSEQALTCPRPSVSLEPRNFYGPKVLRKRTRSSLRLHFTAKTRPPLVEAGPILSSDQLIKDVNHLISLLGAVRSVRCVEMEAAGIYRAARRADREYPVLVARGLSDIVGLKRTRRRLDTLRLPLGRFTHSRPAPRDCATGCAERPAAGAD